MRHHFALVLTVVSILLVSAAAVYAAPSDPADTFTGTGGAAGTAFGTTDKDNLEIQSGGLGTCTPSRTTYLRWSLVGVNTELGDTSKLVLFVNQAQNNNTGFVTLYEVQDDSWDEATLTGNTPAPALGSVIASVPTPTVAGGTITFTGTALATWLNKNTFYTGGNDNVAGNDKVSFAVQVANCPGFSNPVRFDSKDKPGGTAPLLQLYNPTAVTMSTFRAADPAVNWPLIVGLGALAAVVVGGLAVSRRRAARG